jgi:hypothetical protein
VLLFVDSDASAILRRCGDGGGGRLHKWVFDRGEERVLAEALRSRPGEDPGRVLTVL